MLDGLARLFFIRGIDDLTGWLTAIFMNIAFSASLREVLKLETLYKGDELDEFIQLVSGDEERRKWVRDLTTSGLPLSHRKKGLVHDIELMQRIDTIPVDRITFPVKWHHAEYLRDNIPQAELLDVHGGHFMWVGKDMEKIKDKRVEFLNSLYKRK
jgi:hypothetical protein